MLSFFQRWLETEPAEVSIAGVYLSVYGLLLGAGGLNTWSYAPVCVYVCVCVCVCGCVCVVGAGRDFVL